MHLLIAATSISRHLQNAGKDKTTSERGASDRIPATHTLHIVSDTASSVATPQAR